ncbi:MAG TPA: ATP-binding protein [Longimicrobium sp.]|nr:ATP-binding protein [Longimicrobium sp.]
MNSEDPGARSAAEVVFPATSEMGRLARLADWAGTPLGPVESWSRSLRTSAGLVLGQGIAMNLCWGPELLQIYNDAYRVIMGDKHPAGLGRSVLWSWAEIRGDILPLFERVWRGETVYFEDLHLRVDRHGTREDAYFTFSYSPVPGEGGEVGGVLINCYETTDQVRVRALQADRDRLLGALRVERERLEYVFKQAPAFLAVLRGPEHVFELANDAYYQLVGHRDLLGKPVRDALPEVVTQGFVDLLDGVLRTGEPFIGREIPVQLARTPGTPPEERFLDFSYLPLLEADGARAGIIAHGTDVTEPVIARREVERLLRESERERAAAETARAGAEAARADAEAARVEAEHANRAKADFLASMSHELRTPLNAIGGYVELVTMGIHGPVTDQQRSALARVRASQEHLLTLINDVLAFARVEAGRIELHPRALAARELIGEVEPLVAPLAAAREITLFVDACDPLLRVRADDERVRQILLNLVGNAIKFTQPGGWVKLWCERAENRVHICVGDNGPGIALEKQATVFDPFIQVGRRLSNPRDGVGLGLAISRDLARAMGGDLGVASVPGEGSTFILRLPAADE